jgi:hypothetical protein
MATDDPKVIIKREPSPGEDILEEGVDTTLPVQSPAEEGEESASGSSPRPTADDDVEEMVEEVIGIKPKKGQSLADMINKSERARVGFEDEEEEDEEIPAINEPDMDDEEEALKPVEDPDVEDLKAVEELIPEDEEDLTDLPDDPNVERLEDLEEEDAEDKEE